MPETRNEQKGQGFPSSKVNILVHTDRALFDYAKRNQSVRGAVVSRKAITAMESVLKQIRATEG